MLNLWCVVNGVDVLCVVMLFVVFEWCCGFKLLVLDVYVLTVGGICFVELGVDLVIVLVIVLVVKDCVLFVMMVVVGEISLVGEVCLVVVVV